MRLRHGNNWSPLSPGKTQGDAREYLQRASRTVFLLSQQSIKEGYERDKVMVKISGGGVVTNMNAFFCHYNKTRLKIWESVL